VDAKSGTIVNEIPRHDTQRPTSRQVDGCVSGENFRPVITPYQGKRRPSKHRVARELSFFVRGRSGCYVFFDANRLIAQAGQ
jgi:hypothetical protein